MRRAKSQATTTPNQARRGGEDAQNGRSLHLPPATSTAISEHRDGSEKPGREIRKGRTTTINIILTKQITHRW